jgi:carnitine O-acetyltransferase
LILDGFFDAGMLLQALKARGGQIDKNDAKASEKVRRRDVGKKLRLVEY